MRHYLLIPILVIVPFLAIHFLSMASGEVLSGIVFGLTILVTVLAWFAGRPASGRYSPGRG